MPSPRRAAGGGRPAPSPWLLQVILPDNETILSVQLTKLSRAADELTFVELIDALLADSANATALRTVFGARFKPHKGGAEGLSQGASASVRSRIEGSSRDATHWRLDEHGTRWGLQAVIVSEANRQWAPGEVERIGDGESHNWFAGSRLISSILKTGGTSADILPLLARVVDFLSSPLISGDSSASPAVPSQSPQSASRAGTSSSPADAFSNFHLTTHLHRPRLRLVVHAPETRLRLRFAHIPEITEEWEGRCWYLPAPRLDGADRQDGEAQVSALIEAVCEEMGIRRSVTQGTKSARVVYALAIPASPTLDAHGRPQRTAMPPPPPLPPDTDLHALLPRLRHQQQQQQQHQERTADAVVTDQAPVLLFTLDASWLSHLGTVAQGFGKHAKRSKVNGGSLLSPFAQTDNLSRSRPPQVPELDKEAAQATLSALHLKSFQYEGAEDGVSVQPMRRNASQASETSEDGEQGGTLKGRDAVGADQSASMQAAAAAAEEGDLPAPIPRSAKPSSSANSSKPRLSQMFEGWLGGSSAPPPEPASQPASARSSIIGSPVLQSAPVEPASTPRTPSAPSRSNSMNAGGVKGISVSMPIRLDDKRASLALASPNPSGETSPHDLEKRFELLMQDLGIKGASRTAMLALPDERKWFLINQNDQLRGDGDNETKTHAKAARSSSTSSSSSSDGPSTAGAGVLADTWSKATSLAGNLNRFSIASVTGWSSSDAAPEGTADAQERAVDSPRTAYTALSSSAEGSAPSTRPTTVVSDNEPGLTSQKTGITVQHTGSSSGAAAMAANLWSSWWGGSPARSSETLATSPIESRQAGATQTPSSPQADRTGRVRANTEATRFALALLNSGKQSRKDLVKTLISLRVTLSSAKMAWIEDFLLADGLVAIEKVLQEEAQPLVDLAPTAKRKPRKDMSDTVFAECIKCLRTLMNTQVSSDRLR